MHSPYQCQSSSEKSGQVFTPNISDFYFTPENAPSAGSTSNGSFGYTYIYNLPPESADHEDECSGTVVAMQYCYHRIRRNKSNVFRFLYLAKCELEFKIMKIFRLIYDETNCTMGVCCHKMSLGRQAKFDLTSLSNFTFGIEIRRAALIAFGDITTEHNIEHFQAQLNDATLKRGRSFSLTESNGRSNVTPLLFRMFIDGMLLLLLNGCIYFIVVCRIK